MRKCDIWGKNTVLFEPLPAPFDWYPSKPWLATEPLGLLCRIPPASLCESLDKICEGLVLTLRCPVLVGYSQKVFERLSVSDRTPWSGAWEETPLEELLGRLL